MNNLLQHIKSVAKDDVELYFRPMRFAIRSIKSWIAARYEKTRPQANRASKH